MEDIKDPIIQKTIRVRESDYKTFKLLNKKNIPFHRWFHEVIGFIEERVEISSSITDSVLNQNLNHLEIFYKYILNEAINDLTQSIKLIDVSGKESYWKTTGFISRYELKVASKTIYSINKFKDEIFDMIICREDKIDTFKFLKVDEKIYSEDILNELPVFNLVNDLSKSIAIVDLFVNKAYWKVIGENSRDKFLEIQSCGINKIIDYNDEKLSIEVEFRGKYYIFQFLRFDKNIYSEDILNELPVFPFHSALWENSYPYLDDHVIEFLDTEDLSDEELTFDEDLFNF